MSRDAARTFYIGGGRGADTFGMVAKHQSGRALQMKGSEINISKSFICISFFNLIKKKLLLLFL